MAIFMISALTKDPHAGDLFGCRSYVDSTSGMAISA